MPFTKVQDAAGVYKDDTPLTAAMFYVDSDKIRFLRGKWQVMGGWESATSDAFTGICRGLFVWRNNSSQPLAALGTHTNVYAFYDGDLYDITPVVERGTLTNPFTTTLGSATVTVHDVDHGRTAGSDALFANAAAVGGITIAGRYTIAGITDADNYTVTHSAAATASAGPGGGTVDYDYYLAIGLEDGLGGLGYGVGAFGEGGFGEGADINEFFPRTWSFDNFGQNLLACPRGGGIFEWSPATANPQLVTNGDFSSATGWTPGIGWAIAAGTATATAGTASDLSTAVTLAAGAWFLLEFDYTRSAGTLQPMIGTTNIGSALSSASGRVRAAFYTADGLLIFHKDATFAGTVDNVSVKQILTLEPIPEAPSQNTYMLVTAEGMVMALGTIDIDTGDFDPLLSRWSARRNARLWAPGFEDGNTSGFYRLSLGARIVKGLNGRGEILLHTDDCLYSARFNPDPTINYSFTHLGRGNGLIGPNAATIAGGVDYWFGSAGEFMRYAGGAIEHLPCPVRRDFVENLAPSQKDKIYASGIASFNEVIWLYPDTRDGNECSRYLKYNWAENNGAGCWDVGTFDRSAWVDSRAFSFPLAAGTNGTLYFQEKGDSADGDVLTGFIAGGAYSLANGNLAAVMGLIPDFAGLVGGLKVTISNYLYPSSAATTLGPYDITSMTTQVDFRATGRQIAVRYDFNSAPAFARQGTIQLDIRATGSGR
jgi:hypothetical protein